MFIPQIVVSEELKARLREIDRIKAEILSCGPLPEATLQRMEQEFAADHVHHAGSLHSYLKSQGLD
jgi:hypothetical protein